LNEEYKEMAKETIDGANTTPALWHLQKEHHFEKRRGKPLCFWNFFLRKGFIRQAVAYRDISLSNYMWLTCDSFNNAAEQSDER